MARRFVEAEHPRHPGGTSHGGRFRDKASGWVGQLSNEIARNRKIALDQYVPGNWQEITGDEWLEEQSDRIATMLEGYGIDLTVQAGVEVLEKAVAELDVPDRIYANGHHRIMQYPVDGDKDWPSLEVRQQTDELLQAFPLIEPLNLVLRPRLTLSQTGDGASLMGSGMVQLSERVLSDEPAIPGHFMAQRWTNDYWRYALVHEWGHMIDVEGKMLAQRRVVGPQTDQAQEERIRLWKALGPDDPVFNGNARYDMSDYGRQNDNEGVAEAFAEWFLSKGQTRNNAAKEYARHYGWDKVWPRV